MGEMLRISEYALLNGYSPQTVRKWAQKGLLEGTQRVPAVSGYEYRIPMDAMPPAPTGRPRIKNGVPESAWNPAPVQEKSSPPEPPKRTRREINRYIRQHAGDQTYARISRELGLTTLEVRAIYEKLHRKYHV